MTTNQTPDSSTETITVKILWGSRSSGGKWARRAIDALKANGGTYDPTSKVWTIPADTELSVKTWESLEQL